MGKLRGKLIAANGFLTSVLCSGDSELHVVICAELWPWTLVTEQNSL